MTGKVVAELDIKELDESGTFEGYGAIFGNRDAAGDVIVPGAFKASLTEHSIKKSTPVLLWQHDPRQPIGKWMSVSEDERGLRVKGKLTLGVEKAREAYALLQDGALTGLSIGYQTVKSGFDRKTGARLLKQVKLHEISLVTLPANEDARIASVKADFLHPSNIEHALRDAGLSRTQAKAIMAKGLGAVQNLRDADSEAVENVVNAIKARIDILANISKGNYYGNRRH